MIAVIGHRYSEAMLACQWESVGRRKV